MAENVPICFDYKGKNYKGYFIAVSGSGANVWHLMIDNYYRGNLQYTEKSGWQYYGNSFGDMAEFFADYIILWFE